MKLSAKFNIHPALIAFAVLLLFFITFFLIIFGVTWFSLKALPYLFIISIAIFALSLLIVLPLSFFAQCRYFVSKSLLIFSIIYVATLWCYSLIIVMVIWGLPAAVFGLFMGIFGIIPLGIIASLFNSLWYIFLNQFLLVAATFLTLFYISCLNSK